MRTDIALLASLSIVFLGRPTSVYGQKSDLVPASKRAESIQLAEKLLRANDIPGDGKQALPNPFTPRLIEQPAVPSATIQPRQNSVVSSRERLRQISSLINPTGMVILGGEPILLFGQKKFKIGDSVPIVFEGSPYELIITAIERTSFTLRLHNEELTRPIKPGSKS